MPGTTHRANNASKALTGGCGMGAPFEVRPSVFDECAAATSAACVVTRKRGPSCQPRHWQQSAVIRNADDSQRLLSGVVPVEPDLAQSAVLIAYRSGSKKTWRRR